jgi:uncharacterized protein YndB with AHSA1/START domain
MVTDYSVRFISEQVVVQAGVDEIWNAWTTPDGIKSFFAPACNIELRVNGPYEIFFNPDAEPGSRGADDMRILALQPGVMLSFTWNAPLELPNVRLQRTHVTVRFISLDEKQTLVFLTHDGWGTGEEWDQAFTYFARVWKDVVLKRLVHRFSVGPINWKEPPKLEPA